MTPEDARKLIGGYATGNLGDEERKALFAAALSEQELFDELVKEQALKELLDDPQARRRLLEQLRPAPQRNVLWRWAAAGSLGLATVMIAVVMMRIPDKPQSTPVLTATRLPAPAALPTPPPVAAPVAPPAAGSIARSAARLREMAQEMAPKRENKVAAEPPTVALAGQVDAVAKTKSANQAAASFAAGTAGRIAVPHSAA